MTPDVIVIGAGVAGLAAATALAEGGARVLVAEARGQLGGRTSSYRDPQTGSYVDNGQHVVLGCYRETFTYLNRIGATEGIALQPSLEMPTVDASGRISSLRCPAWPSPWHLVGGLLAWEVLDWRDRMSVVRLLPPLLRARRTSSRATRGSGPADAQTVSAWLREHGQTPHLCDVLWEPLAVAALNQAVDSASAAPFIAVLGRIFGGDPRDAAIGLPIRPLSDVFGEPAARYLTSHGLTVYRHAPARLLVQDGKATGIAIRGRQLSAGAIVAAVPWTGWRTLLHPDESQGGRDARVLRDAALARRSSPIVTVNLWPDRKVVGTRFVSMPGRLFQWAFNKAGAEDDAWTPRRSHVSLVCSGASTVERESDDVLVARAWRELQGAFADARAATLLHASVFRERHATFSLAPGEPPRPANATPIKGLWLAGDWTETGLPATIEGAALSGHTAALRILAS